MLVMLIRSLLFCIMQLRYFLTRKHSNDVISSGFIRGGRNGVIWECKWALTLIRQIRGLACIPPFTKSAFSRKIWNLDTGIGSYLCWCHTFRNGRMPDGTFHPLQVPTYKVWLQPNRNIHIVFSTPSFSEFYLQMRGVFEELDQEEEWSFLKWESCILKLWHLKLLWLSWVLQISKRIACSYCFSDHYFFVSCSWGISWLESMG